VRRPASTLSHMWERCPNSVRWHFVGPQMELIEGGVRPLVFLISMVFVATAALLLRAALGPSSPVWANPNAHTYTMAVFLCFFAFALIAIPISHLFRRDCAYINAASGVVVLWRRMIIPVQLRTYDLRQYRNVGIRRKCTRRRSVDRIQYCVVLENSDSTLELVHQIQSQLSAEHLAKRISQLCSLPCH